jgi:hypothetical protein
MSDHEIKAGNISILRRTRKVKQANPRAIRAAGLKSFTLNRKSSEERKTQPAWSKTFSKGLVKSLIHKK